MSPLGACPPFLIVNANNITHNTNSQTYRRKYSWGACDIENPDYTDFLLLYNLLIGYLYFPLKERTKALYDVYQERKTAKNEKIKLSKLKEQNTGTGSIGFGVGLVTGLGVLGAFVLLAKKSNLFK